LLAFLFVNLNFQGEFFTLSEKCNITTNRHEVIMNQRIEVNPDICHGKPVIRGTRIMVRNILGSFASGESAGDIMRNYPELTAEDIEAAIAYAIELVDDTQLSMKAS
jgi:uncharacterized protein (DUF433 family)